MIGTGKHWCKQCDRKSVIYMGRKRRGIKHLFYCKICKKYFPKEEIDYIK